MEGKQTWNGKKEGLCLLAHNSGFEIQHLLRIYFLYCGHVFSKLPGKAALTSQGTYYIVFYQRRAQSAQQLIVNNVPGTP